MSSGVVILVIEAAIGLAGFVWMVVNIYKKNKEPFCSGYYLWTGRIKIANEVF